MLTKTAMTVEKSIVIAVLSYDNITTAALSSTLLKCLNPLPYRALPRNNTLSTLLPLFHQLPEFDAEHGAGGCNGDGVGDGLCEKYRKDFVGEKVRKYVYERYEQDYLPENCKEGGDLCVAEGDEALLTGVLSAHEENRRHVYSESPHGQVRKLRLRGEYHDRKLRKEHADGPEQSGVCQAAFQEKGEAFLYAIEISRAVVEADYRLSALSKPLKREKGELHDAGQNGHGPHGGVAAVFQQGGVEAEHQQAFGGLHDEGSNAESKAGRENMSFHLKILFLNAKNGDVSREKL